MLARHGLLLSAAAVSFGLTACGSTPTTAAPPAAAPTSSAPTSATPASAVPSSAAPSRSVAGTTPSSSHKATTAAVPCPSARTLEKLTDLPEDWHFPQSDVKCWKSWATARPEGPRTGDGVYLFENKPGTGWRYHSQGSAFDCADLGIHEPAPFCQ